MVYNRRGNRLLVIVESSGCVDSSICRVGRVCENGWLGGAGHFAMAALGGLLQKGGVPAAPSGTATLLRLSPSHLVRPRRRPPPTSGARGSHGLTGGVYKARERIHRAMADARLLANPASWSRVADSNPN